MGTVHQKFVALTGVGVPVDNVRPVKLVVLVPALVSPIVSAEVVVAMVVASILAEGVLLLKHVSMVSA